MTNGIIGAYGCRNCAHRLIEGNLMLCTFNPPTNAPVYAVTADAKTGALTPNVMGWVAAFPTVNPNSKCGQHKFVAAYNDVPAPGATRARLAG